ncbi:long-chain fatty acid--CoA ligase [Neobacillus sp. GCM10023253]|uniref:long-chain fatty acid--CoA ligase n=1 Tax=Neobacillus sp. GCM10023253 TaxID=3252644 RepID=UPI003608DBAC
MNSLQLNLRTFLERTAKFFPDKEIVSRESDGSIFRYNYSEFYQRVKKLANVLKSLGIEKGDKIASMAWNNHRHLELYLGVPCYGAALHTVNIRYGHPEIIYTINHAEDKVLFFDEDLLPIVEAISPQLPHIEAYVFLGKNLPDTETKLSPLYCYEELLEQAETEFQFEMLDEYTPATICFTSATTGLPKGVTYTQRSLYLYTSALLYTDVTAISEKDCIMPIVPMFHVNAWGLPYAAIATGAKLVLPGTRPNAHQLLSLIESESVTVTAAAVTIGVEMANILEEHPYQISSLRALFLGGQAPPKAIIEKFLYQHRVPVVQGYGATETSPLITFLHFRKDQENNSESENIHYRTRQGILIPGIEMKIVDEFGEEILWDDQEMGEILARGPWVASEYLNDDRSASSFDNGWWKSGDIATINKQGAIRLVDRNKDLIKSGGEWISSVQLENELMAHPEVTEACVVAMPDEKWLERPLAYVVLKQDGNTSLLEEELSQWLAARFPKWWLPDRYEFTNEIPKNANGKYNKNLLRQRFSEKLV